MALKLGWLGNSECKSLRRVYIGLLLLALQELPSWVVPLSSSLVDMRTMRTMVTGSLTRVQVEGTCQETRERLSRALTRSWTGAMPRLRETARRGSTTRTAATLGTSGRRASLSSAEELQGRQAQQVRT